MKLNHLDLQVSDVPAAVAFFERYFDFEPQSKRTSEAIAFLSDRHGFTFVVQRAKDGVPAYPDGFHFGFLVDDEATVRDLHARMRADGVPAVSEVIVNGRGTMFYVTGPGPALIEVSCRKH